jgi:hypothetical protein
MNLKRKILLLSIFVIFISVCGVYATQYHQNTDNLIFNFEDNNLTNDSGCCSVVVQIDENHSMMSYRRDAALGADIFIEKVNWSGTPAVKQYKTENGYFNHVVVTNTGWIIGLGGIDDGEDNQRCENITAGMINDNNTISESDLQKIQSIKQAYGLGHVIVKAPNGNYGFATVDMLKTGTLKPGQYISLPNKYTFSRAGEFPVNSSDRIKDAIDLARTDQFGLTRRGIMTYDFQVTDEGNVTDIYLSNDDGSYFGQSNSGNIDNILFNNTTYLAKDIPIAPSYKSIGNVTFVEEQTDSPTNGIFTIGFIVLFVIFVGILFFVLLRFVRILRYNRYKR